MDYGRCCGGSTDITLPNTIRILAGVLSLTVFPLIVISAFYSTLHIVPQTMGGSPFFGFANPNVSNSTIPSSPQSKVRLPGFLNFSISIPHLPTINIGDMLLVLALVLFVLAFLRNVRTRKIKNDYDEAYVREEKLFREKTFEILQEASARLRASTGGYRQTVLDCYHSISLLLEEKSSTDSTNLTPREFKELISKKLGLESKYLASVTDLFELARYSQHEISGFQAREASICLEELGRELKSLDQVVA
ncbi:MAG: DUF4129 domain-containing protein [Nitrososphaerales archaeon]